MVHEPGDSVNNQRSNLIGNIGGTADKSPYDAEMSDVRALFLQKNIRGSVINGVQS